MTGRNPGRGTLKTKKHKVALDLTWNTLPTDVIITIAFFIPDAADLFTYLEALRVFNVLGPLEHLHKLGTKRRHQDLWPSLTITTATLQSQFILSYEAIVKYYARVVIHDISDFQWLRTHLNPKVQVEWNANDLPVPEEILDNWTDLRITRLDCYFYSRDTSKLNEILPRLPHLSALKACLRDTLDYLCPLVAKSTQLTELQLITLMDDVWRESHFLDFIHWLSTQPVRQFRFGGRHRWYTISSGIKQRFYESLLNCPTLVKVILDNGDVGNLDFSRFTFSMKSLLVFGLDSMVAKLIADRLKDSKVEDLCLRAFHRGEKDGTKFLLEVLPDTPIKTLSLDNIRIGRKSWCEIAPLLEKCPLKTLAFRFDKLYPEVAQCIANAIQANKTICQLVLTGGGIAINDIQTLIEGMTHPSRPVQTKQIKWIREYRRVVHAEPLAKLKQLARERGGEFLF